MTDGHYVVCSNWSDYSDKARESRLPHRQWGTPCSWTKGPIFGEDHATYSKHLSRNINRSISCLCCLGFWFCFPLSLMVRVLIGSLLPLKTTYCLEYLTSALHAAHKQIQTKPHGHGDVHALLHSSGLASTWQMAGLRWVCFFQVIFRAYSQRLHSFLCCALRHHSPAKEGSWRCNYCTTVYCCMHLWSCFGIIKWQMIFIDYASRKQVITPITVDCLNPPYILVCRTPMP
jgi:hypothetical protein